MHVQIQCPTTDKRVAVSIRSQGGSFADLPPYSATVECPSCGKRHDWRGLQTVGMVPPVTAAGTLKGKISRPLTSRQSAE